MRTTIAAAGILGFALLGNAAADWNIKPPKKTRAIEPRIAVSDSTVFVPVSIKTDDLEKGIKQAFASKSLFKGETQKLSAKALVDKKVTVEEWVDVMVSPAIPCEVKNIEESFKDGVICLNPFRCIDRIRKRVRQVTDCSKQKLAVFQKQLQPVVRLKEELFPTSVKLHYDVKLKDIKIKADGRSLRVGVVLDGTGSADISHGAFGADITIKGALKCDATLSAAAAADVTIRTDASLDLDLKDFAFDWHKLCVPGAVQIAKITFAADPNIQIAALFKDTIKKEVLKLLNREVIDKTVEDNLKLSDKLQEVAQVLQNPIKLANDVLLDIEPKQLAVSQLKSGGSGADNVISIDAGIVARPVVTVGIPVNDSKPKKLPFAVRDLPNRIQLHLKGQIALQPAATRIRDELRKYISANYAAQPFTVGEVEMYQSDTKLVFGLHLVTKSNAPVGKVYLWGEPVVDREKQVLGVTQVGFDTASQTVLANSAAWLLNASLGKVVEEKAKFDLDEKTKKALTQIAKFDTRSGIARISGEVTKIKLEGIWLSGDSLNVLILAEGQARVQFVKN